MKQRTWHSGPPPSVGWWPASKCQDPEIIRWWDGDQWSLGVSSKKNAKFAAISASKPALSTYNIEWTERWWE